MSDDNAERLAAIAINLRERYAFRDEPEWDDFTEIAAALEVAQLSPVQPTEASGWEAVAADLEYRLTQIAVVLSKYDETDEGSADPQCAPEDRWRLYRDIIAIIERGNMDEVPPHFDPADQGRIIDIVSDAIKHNFGATMSTHRDGDTMVIELTSWPRAQEAMRALEDAGFRAERIKGTGQSIRTWRTEGAS